MNSSNPSATLTDEQRLKIEENRQRALEKLASNKKRAHDGEDNQATGTDKNGDSNTNVTTTSTTTTNNNNKKVKWTRFYEYDLSTMENTKGGFIVDEAVEEKVNRFKDQATKIEPNYLSSFDPLSMPKCKECHSTDIDNNFIQVFNLSICHACKEKYPDKYSLITKTEAREDYLLTDPELKDKELLPHWSKPNPRKSTWNNMMLYVREMVEEYAFKKWGGPEGLDAEYERRESQKKEKKDKKFKEKLADLRRRTMTSSRERKRQEGPHRHEFGDPEEDENGSTIQTCKTCNMVIESEEF